MKTVLFDVCHTLYRSNTTYDFLDFHLGGHARFERFQAERRGLMARVRAKLSAGDQYRDQAIGFLQGASEAYLRSSAVQFVETLQEIEPTIELLNSSKQQGDQVYLISASLDILVEPIAAKLNVDGYFASELEFNEGVCEGRLKLDLLGNKTDLIETNFAKAGSIMVSDNFSDANCIRVVEGFRPVYSSGDVRAKMFWKTKPVVSPIRYE